jgi:hypothetical protein
MNGLAPPSFFESYLINSNKSECGQYSKSMQSKGAWSKSSSWSITGTARDLEREFGSWFIPWFVRLLRRIIDLEPP